ncbi:hypothetical protein Tco_0820891 [Tanacetum coccineum]|uniref:Uncharacterized protein n=1 Tax=Tanacetum coccineum TaxID=301880 RepID=A0ABQ5ADQ1_9ASTR
MFKKRLKETSKKRKVEPDIVIPVNVDDEEDEITDEANPINSREIQELSFKNYRDDMVTYWHITEKFLPGNQRLIHGKETTKEEINGLSLKLSCKNVGLSPIYSRKQQHQLYLAMKADPLPSAIRPRDQDDPHDDAHPEGENSAKRQKTSEYEAYVSGESSSGQVNIEEPCPSTLGNQEQDDEFDFWTNSYASDDDEIPTKQVSQDIMEEISLTIDEAKLKKMADEMLRQRCTSGDEHQYHIDQMKNFLQSDIVWESRKEILVSPHPRKITPLVQSCQRDPEAPALSLINQDLLYLRREFRIVQVIKTFWELGHEHKFITEIMARRANDGIVSITEPDYKNLNKNDIEDMYLLIINNKVPDYADTGLLWSLSVFIRSSVIWERVHDFQLGIKSYQQKINLIAPTITFPGIEECDVFSIVYEPVHGIISTTSKIEKRVTRPLEIHKFYDATLRRTLEGLKSYYNDVKYGYVQK